MEAGCRAATASYRRVCQPVREERITRFTVRSGTMSQLAGKSCGKLFKYLPNFNFAAGAHHVYP